MEKYIQKLEKKMYSLCIKHKVNNKFFVKKLYLFVCLFFLISVGYLRAQVPSLTENIRIPLWAEIDVYPGLKESTEMEGYEYPIQEVKKIASFLINGMVYGWEFVYVPSDKTRGVEEYFEVKEIQQISLSSLKNTIKYSSPWIDDTLFCCWCDYSRTNEQIQNYKAWSSIKNPVIGARGYGKIEDGFNGIKSAAEDSLKQAVREYYRGKVKNKPKEITGSVLIKSEPLLGIDAGRYAINLDFFLECGKIIEYTAY